MDYSYINQLNGGKDLLLLKLKLKELLSFNISAKYRPLRKEYNKEIIERIESEKESIINESNDVNNHFYDTLKFILNITFERLA